jgi:hypothetical protein
MLVKDQSFKLVTMIVSAARSLTMGGISGPSPGVEPSCLGIDDETGAKIRGDTADASVVASTEMGA